MGKRVFSLRKFKVALFVFAMLFAVFGGMLEARNVFGDTVTPDEWQQEEYTKCIRTYSQYEEDIIREDEGSYIFEYTGYWPRKFKGGNKNVGVSFGCGLHVIVTWDEGGQAGMAWVSWEKETQKVTSEPLVIEKGPDGKYGKTSVYFSGSVILGSYGAQPVKVRGGSEGNRFIDFVSYKNFKRGRACQYDGDSNATTLPDGQECWIESHILKDELDVDRFIEQAEKVEHNEYDEYRASIDVYRQSDSSVNSDKWEKQDLVLRVKKDKPAPEPEYGRYYAVTNFAVVGEGQSFSDIVSTGWTMEDDKMVEDGKENAGTTHITVGESALLTFSHQAGACAGDMYCGKDYGMPSYYNGDISSGTELKYNNGSGNVVKAKWSIGREHDFGGERTSNGLVSKNIIKGENKGEEFKDGETLLYTIEEACMGTFKRSGGDGIGGAVCDGKNEGEGEAQDVRIIRLEPNGDDSTSVINLVGPFYTRGERTDDISVGGNECKNGVSVAGYEMFYTDNTNDFLKCGRRRFNARNQYRIRFYEPGVYRFCESINVEGVGNYAVNKAKATGCAKVYVDGVTVEIMTDKVFAGETANVKHSFKFRGIEGEKAKVIAYVSNDNENGKEAKRIKGDVLCQNAGFSVFEGECREEDLKVVFGGGKTAIMNVFDVSAGNYYCVAVAFSLFNSNDNSWYVSKPDCKKIGKKPSLQVWGTGMYTAGDIALNNAEKRVVNGIYGFTLKNQSNTTVFGTWVEQNILANGIVNTASGAATGRKDGELGGSKEGKNLSVCIRSPLTMPNKNCSPIVKPGGGSFARPEDKGKLIDKLKENNCRQESSIGELSVKKGESYFYCSGGNFTINGNIRYEDGYNMISDIPKAIVYSKRDIIIGCGVTRIDAVLIAEGIINTCNNNDVNSRDRSNQLKINGAIIANKLKANRTYGASVGMESGTPAEIINYDTSLYLWGASESDVTKTGKLKVVYQTELPPRL